MITHDVYHYTTCNRFDIAYIQTIDKVLVKNEIINNIKNIKNIFHR